MNDKMRVLAMIQLARESLQEGDLPNADVILQNLLHGDIQPEENLIEVFDRVQWDRGFKKLCAETNTHAVYIAAERTGIVGHLKISAGGDGFLLEQFAPVLRQLTGGGE